LADIIKIWKINPILPKKNILNRGILAIDAEYYDKMKKGEMT
jgi:hypothetical protein